MCRVILAALSFVIVPLSTFAQTAAWDSHDLNGIWIRTGGDRGYNNDVPPMTAWGLEKFNSYKPAYGRQLGSSDAAARSEEHTSELQSHSFISYAVFCL